MSLDLAGIHNVGEFYSHHYLTALLEHDLAATLSRWTKAEDEGGAKAPPKLLAALATRFFAAQAKAAGQADPAVRLEAARGFHPYLLEALGYERRPGVEEIGDGEVVPVVATYEQNRRPYLWIVEAPFGHEADEGDPLDESPSAEQVPAGLGGTGTVKLATQSWRELLDGSLLRHEDAPRWVLVLGGADVFLVDRDKWPAGKLLHFDLGELMSRRQAPAMRAMAGLLHREVLLPEGGQSLLDVLDENSHKHAFAVSTDLKYGARQAIELIANEAIHYLRTVSKDKVFGDDELARKLTRESLFYLYRLLFLFYVEARSAEMVDEGGNTVVPMKSDAYLQGYSLESLRELEQVPLVSVEAREGFFLDTSLRKLFELVFRGHGYGQREFEYGGAATEFTISGLRSPLFDEDRTPILKSVKLRNVVVQRVIELLSLSREGKRRQRGRISYATLGINQLGAVYEGLLSYTGFFAQTELYEIRAANEMKDPEARTYFVPPEKIGDYTDDEKVRDERGVPIKHAKGAYLFRLAGRDREKSASYYTPEVLTRCLTKYTLKERLGEVGTESYVPADEILKLVVCEPAMGSGAFLNEAVNQLADAYLERKQAELGRRIPAERMGIERQRVKYLIATNNCYGVDLNPLAAELGKVSLWLNVLQPGVHAPYFDRRIAVGNSLIGARREVFDGADLRKAGGKKGENWLTRVPVRVGFGEERPAGSVYHFLVPDLGMVPFDGDKVIAGLEPENVKLIKKWRKEICKPFSEGEVERLVRISDRVDELWGEHVAQRVRVLAEVRQAYPVWPATEEGLGEGSVPAWVPGVEECEEKAKELDRDGAPGGRLKAVMDYWVALWFWPASRSRDLPERRAWLDDVDAALERNSDAEASRRWDVVRSVSTAERAFHWELMFAEAFSRRGGMDLILGNPPWSNVEWKEMDVIGDVEPVVVLRKFSARRVAEISATHWNDPSSTQWLRREFESTTGCAAYLSAVQSYALLAGARTNLYKCFMVRAWSVSANRGSVGLIVQSNFLDDTSGNALRAAASLRLRLLARFRNELKLFREVHNLVDFSLCVYGATSPVPKFLLCVNLFHPSTLEASLSHDGMGAIPGIQDSEGWDRRGHRARVVVVDSKVIHLFATIYDDGGPEQGAKIPLVHDQDSLSILAKLGASKNKLSRRPEGWFATQHFNETTSQQDGTLRRSTVVPGSLEEMIFSGPHFHVANPFYKTPRDKCSHNKDYSAIDLCAIGADYLPRTNYVRVCDLATFVQRTPHWQGRPVTEWYRWIARKMLAPSGERTLVCCIIPPGPAHIDGCFSIAFDSDAQLLAFASISSSMLADFMVRSSAKSNLREELVGQLPVPEFSACGPLIARCLRLNALASSYGDLWARAFSEEFTRDSFASGNPCLSVETPWASLTSSWTGRSGLRSSFARRQALLEIDVLAAGLLGVSIDELCSLNRVQFPVAMQYDGDTYYDQQGAIVFTGNRGLPDVGLDRGQWEAIRGCEARDELPDFAASYVPPFFGVDREQDLRRAHDDFRSRRVRN